MSVCSPVIIKSCCREVAVLGILNITSLIYFILFKIRIQPAWSRHERIIFGVHCEISLIGVLDYTVRSIFWWTCDWSYSHLNSWNDHIVLCCQNRVMHAIFNNKSSAVDRIFDSVISITFHDLIWLAPLTIPPKSLSWPLACNSKPSFSIVSTAVPLPMTKSFRVSSKWLKCFLLWLFFLRVDTLFEYLVKLETSI